jgi:hypothetical protein
MPAVRRKPSSSIPTSHAGASPCRTHVLL